MTGPNLQIGFVTHGEAFHGASPEQKALGGSETALVQMARAMSQRGHVVQVFCNCPKPGDYQGVKYRDNDELVRAAAEERFDILIVSRFSAAFELPLQAGVKVLWNHDILDKPDSLAPHLDSIDLALVLSRFHARDYAASLPRIADKLVVTRNGLDTGLLAQASLGVGRVSGRVAYVSRPERGLKLLLEDIWPKLFRQLPHLNLTVCGYKVSQIGLPAALQSEYARINELLEETPGVEVLGSLAKQDYYQHLASCEALLYPCVFPEISCIAALEAQALGTPIITSDAFALSETVLTPEFKVAGDPGSPGYAADYLTRANKILTSPEEARDLAAGAREKIVAAHDWAVIAAEWEELFLQWLGRRNQAQAPAVAVSMLLAGDRAQASELLGREIASPEPEGAPEDPNESELMEQMAGALGVVLSKLGHEARIGVISSDQGRTAGALQSLLGEAQVEELDDSQTPSGLLDVVLVRDRLEREANPEELLIRALAWCRQEGHLMICTASGAWPLVGPGYLGRRHDLGREEIISLLPGRSLAMVYLQRGLVGTRPDRYFAGRWLALTQAAGPEPGSLDLRSKMRRVRPAPQELVQEVNRAGLI